MSICGIYGLHLDDGVIRYVGKSYDVHERFKGHLRGVNKMSNTQPLYQWIRKHGIENIFMSVLEECVVDLLSEREIHWIAELATYTRASGLNCTVGGDGAVGRIHSQASKDKMRVAATGQIRGPITEETRAKIRERLLSNTSESFKQGRQLGAARGNHSRWHVAQGKTSPTCAYCI